MSIKIEIITYRTSYRILNLTILSDMFFLLFALSIAGLNANVIPSEDCDMAVCAATIAECALECACDWPVCECCAPCATCMGSLFAECCGCVWDSCSDYKNITIPRKNMTIQNYNSTINKTEIVNTTNITSRLVPIRSYSSIIVQEFTIHNKTENSMCIKSNSNVTDGYCSYGCGECASTCVSHGYPLFCCSFQYCCCYVAGTKLCNVDPYCPLTYC